MAVYGIGLSDRDPVTGWEAVTPTRRDVTPQQEQHRQALVIWQLRDTVIDLRLECDYGQDTQALVDVIDRLAKLAKAVEQGTGIVDTTIAAVEALKVAAPTFPDMDAVLDKLIQQMQEVMQYLTNRSSTCNASHKQGISTVGGLWDYRPPTQQSKTERKGSLA